MLQDGDSNKHPVTEPLGLSYTTWRVLESARVYGLRTTQPTIFLPVGLLGWHYPTASLDE